MAAGNLLSVRAGRGPLLPEGEGGAGEGRSEERIVVAGFVLLAFLAGLIIFFASLLDSLT